MMLLWIEWEINNTVKYIHAELTWKLLAEVDPSIEVSLVLSRVHDKDLSENPCSLD